MLPPSFVFSGSSRLEFSRSFTLPQISFLFHFFLLNLALATCLFKIVRTNPLSPPRSKTVARSHFVFPFFSAPQTTKLDAGLPLLFKFCFVFWVEAYDPFFQNPPLASRFTSGTGIGHFPNTNCRLAPILPYVQVFFFPLLLLFGTPLHLQRLFDKKFFGC